MLRQLAARDWLSSIRAKVVKLADLERKARELQEQTGIASQSFDAIGHASGPKDTTGKYLAAIKAQDEMERYKAKLNLEIESALCLLYGPDQDGHGGLARLRGTTTADFICGYYLQAMTWPQVAKTFGWPESKDATQYCKRRAYRALADVDRLGFDYVRNI